MTREEFFTKLENGTTWSAGVAFKRANPLPLDKYAVFNTEEALNAYVTGPVAYPGHVVALVGEDKTTIYYLDYNREAEAEEEKSQLIAREVGKIPVGDGKTVSVAADGTISLAGVTDLEFERIDEESGETVKIKYQPILDENGITWVEPSTITVEGLDLRLKNVESSVEDITEEIGKAAAGEEAATGLYKLIADEIARATAKEGELEESIENLEKVVGVPASEGVEASGLHKTIADVKVTADENAADIISINTKLDTTDEIARDAQNKIDTFMDTIDVGGENVVDTLQEVIDLIKTGDEVATGLLSDVADLKKADEAHDTAIEEINESLDSKASQSDLNALTQVVNGKVSQGDFDTLSQTVGNKADSQTVTDLTSVVSGKADQSALDTLSQTVNGKADQSALDTLSQIVSGKADSSTVSSLADTVTQHTTDISNINTALDGKAASSDLTALTGRVTKNEEDILALQSNKVEKKTTDYNGVATEWTLLSPENQAKLSALVIEDGNIEISGKVNVENVEGLPALLNNKVDTVSISNGTVEYENSVADANGFATKLAKITLGIATDTLVGAVKSVTLASDGSNATAAMNKIAVNEDGTMEVNSLNVNKLVQNDSDTLILNGGASKN